MLILFIITFILLVLAMISLQVVSTQCVRCPRENYANKITMSYENFWPGSENFGFFAYIKKRYPEVIFVSKEQDPDIMIFSLFGDIDSAKKYRGKKIFFYGENLDRYPPYNDIRRLREVYDLIVGFRSTSKDLKEIRFPLWMTYYKFVDSETLMRVLDDSYKTNSNIRKRNEATLIASHDDYGQRTIICNEVEKYIPIKYGGKFRNNVKIEESDSKTGSKKKFIKQYKFNICPENTEYENYWTEKVFQALEAGCIPIYWAIKPPEPEILNEKCYCFVEITDPEDIKKKIRHVVHSPEEYKVNSIFKSTAKKELDKILNELNNALDKIIFQDKLRLQF